MNPKYILELKNLHIDKNHLTFDIYLQHTNEIHFEYAGGQYILEFNPEIANGGNLHYTILKSELPRNMIPRNPSVGDAKNPDAKILRLALNTFPGPGGGFYISKDFPGTKIVKMKLTTTSDHFADVPLNLSWRKPPIVAFATKIFAYVGAVNTDISNPRDYKIEESIVATN